MTWKKITSMVLLLCVLMSMFAMPGVGAAVVDTAETGANVELALDTVQTNMDQNLQTIFGSESVGVECFSNCGDFAVDGCVDFAVGGNDCNAITQDLLGENIIWNLFQRDSLAAERSQDGLESGFGFAAHCLTPLLC